LYNLKKINIFVGANNSGKSRFLRQIFKGKPDDFVFFDNVNQELEKIYEILNPQLGNLYYMADLKTLMSSRTGITFNVLTIFITRLKKRKGEAVVLVMCGI